MKVGIAGLAGLATTLLVSGGSVVSAASARADDRYGPHQWCPGQSMDWPAGPWDEVDWDMSVCHTWYVAGMGHGNVPERSGAQQHLGRRRPPPPPSCAVTDIPRAWALPPAEPFGWVPSA